VAGEPATEAAGTKSSTATAAHAPAHAHQRTSEAEPQNHRCDTEEESTLDGDRSRAQSALREPACEIRGDDALVVNALGVR
jgi:hypothetical protein